ncbi:MAG: hypothetical protein IVW57_18765, partial [Ktedonobacterales bacterium]|nr:hypothetical protein [Ktedonobacterales bacterium]
TTLAWAVAQATHIRQYFNGGVLWVSLGREPDLSQLLSRWGALLGIPASTLASLDSLQKWIGTLSNAIGTRRMLLVIDDAWSSVDVDVFRVGGPNCAHLVTTRFPSVAALAATPPTMPIPIRELAEAESLVLLQRLAPETKGCALSRVRSFVQSVGGHPLALKQAGSYLHRTASMAGREVVSASLQRLAKPGVLLQLSELPEEGEWYPGLAPGVSPSLEAVIASLCQGLTEKARAALAALTVFPPKPHVFAEGEALAAAQCSLEALDELLEAGLLEPCAGDSYSLHAVIAAYARVFLAQER